MTKQMTNARAGAGKRNAYRDAALGAVIAARKAGRDARHTASDVASSPEARRAIARARAAVYALGAAATSATSLILAAWRTGSGRAQGLARSREFRALRAKARSAATAAVQTAHVASAAAGTRGAKTWKRAVTRGRRLVSRADRRLRASAHSRGRA